MDYLRCTAEDLLMDPGFCNFCLRRQPADIAFWEDWIQKHPEKAALVREAAAMYQLLNGNLTAETFEKDYHRFQATLDEHIHPGPDNNPASTDRIPRSRRKRQSYWIASALSAGLAFTLFVCIRRSEPPRPQTRVAETFWDTRLGERKTVQLPDGTTVRLNAGSHFSITAGYGSPVRQVQLEGEAFFDVAKDAQHPFLIHTPAMDIRVLGTSFNVRSYAADPTAETALITGSVEVTLKDGAGRPILLKPAEKISLPNPAHPAPSIASPAGAGAKRTVLSIQKLVVTPVDSVPAEISWTLNCLRFTDQPMEQIAEELGRWYNVSIRFQDEAVKQYRYTASFEKKTIDQVLKALALSRPFAFYWAGPNKIIIRSSGAMKN